MLAAKSSEHKLLPTFLRAAGCRLPMLEYALSLPVSVGFQAM